ncbi:HipA domain-containing protein [Sulfurovum sp. bin170]|uniref:HipA domain-containing protein n=1 Tax=Sulfurovum sp. bin170 TaxID=2695268 RepID=UPI0013DE8686|nr:HipA domain-containing protein [Sulfurovum sp. bin170]NEW60063.1 HipA domain-containing protein [Sulfurovum sp. bin170]
MNCLGCFKSTKDIYCKKCTRLLFDNQKISSVLDFDKKEFLSKTIELSTSFSISGVQDKISLKIEDKKLTPTSKDGRYILKPIPLMEYGELIEDVAKNEHFTMQLASQVFGLETANNGLISFSDGELAYITKRFDRIDDKKIRQEDFCSLAGQTKDTHGRNYKYDYSYEQIGELIKKYLPTYKIEMVKYFKLVLFNYLVGNGDAHLKNFSITQRRTKEYGLSPAYDLLSSSIHLPNESRTALELFEEYETQSFEANGFYAYDDFMAFADRLGLPQKVTIGSIESFLAKQKATFALLDKSFLSDEAKERYEALFLDRIRAVGYRF